MYKKLFSLTSVFLFFLSPIFTKGTDVPAGKWWYNPKIQRELSITNSETTKLDKLFARNRRKLIRLKSKVEREQAELNRLKKINKPNSIEVKDQTVKRDKAKRNAANERLQYVIGVRNILGAERFDQLKNNYSDWQ